MHTTAQWFVCVCRLSHGCELFSLKFNVCRPQLCFVGRCKSVCPKRYVLRIKERLSFVQPVRCGLPARHSRTRTNPLTVFSTAASIAALVGQKGCTPGTLAMLVRVLRQLELGRGGARTLRSQRTLTQPFKAWQEGNNEWNAGQEVCGSFLTGLTGVRHWQSFLAKDM